VSILISQRQQIYCRLNGSRAAPKSALLGLKSYFFILAFQKIDLLLRIGFLMRKIYRKSYFSAIAMVCVPESAPDGVLL
jgi:hypothetical protein